MKKRINWGTGILITFILFVASILIQVFLYMKTDVDLVTDNYYEKELTYENHIARVNNTGELRGDLNVEYSRDTLKIRFPVEYEHDKISGSLRFYRPSDSSKDFELKIQPDKDCTQLISTANLITGYWKLQIYWDYDAKPYYTEKALMIN